MVRRDIHSEKRLILEEKYAHDTLEKSHYVYSDLH